MSNRQLFGYFVVALVATWLSVVLSRHMMQYELHLSLIAAGIDVRMFYKVWKATDWTYFAK